MARRSRSLPIPVLIVLLIAIGVAVWYKHREAVNEDEKPPIVVQPKQPPPNEPTPHGSPTQAADNAALGMPSNASAETPDDFLIAKPQYVLSFNKTRGIPNWVSWHLTASDLGPVERGQFAPDSTLPKGWYRITPNDYRNIGYDRGHMCPSGDRTATRAANAQTFMMTNVIPQAGGNNQGPWAKLEDYCRDLTRSGNELYIVCGGAGPFSPIADGKLAVPGATWKVIVVLPEGDNDVARLTSDTRVIAVSLPNTSGIRDRDWKAFRTSAAAIEQATGYRFFANAPAPVRSALESRVDNQ